MNDPLGDRMKAYEMEENGRKLMPFLPAFARIDGRAFSSFTKGMKRPYDQGMSDLMIATTKFLAEEFNVNCAYTQSDEITLSWYLPFDTNKKERKMPFGGRYSKLNSILASITTAYFNKNVSKYLDEKYAEKMPMFDCRVWNVPNLEEAANVFLWREKDATKNSITMAAGEFYSESQLRGKSGSVKQEMLFQKGVNWKHYPDFFRKGTYVQRKKVIRSYNPELDASLPEKHHFRKDPDLKVERTDFIIPTLPPLSKLINKVGFLFFGQDPVTQQGSQ
jgi:tRNA(His) guanylyltransferase